MTKHKVLIFISAVAVVGTLGYLSLGKVYAQGTGKYSPLLQRMVEKFNLNTSEVDKVVEEFRAENQSNMQANLEERLNQEVTNGNITPEQKDKILAKHDEMRLENLDRSGTPEERQQKMEERRAEMEQWAKDNGIDVKYVMGFGFGGHFGEFGKGMRNNRE